MLVVLVTPPPVDEEGRMQYAKYDTFFFISVDIVQNEGQMQAESISESTE